MSEESPFGDEIYRFTPAKPRGSVYKYFHRLYYVLTNKPIMDQMELSVVDGQISVRISDNKKALFTRCYFHTGLHLPRQEESS